MRLLIDYSISAPQKHNLTAPRGLTVIAALIAATIVLLNAKGVADYLAVW
jgi:hypothetical protein